MEIEYVKGKPYFGFSDDRIKQYPYLDKDEQCDVVIIGGGVNGAIANYYFTNADVKTILIEKDRIGLKSTACATALLEYQLDDNKEEIKQYLNKQQVVDAYNIGIDALNDIDKFIKMHGNNCHYSKRDTLVYTLKCMEKSALKEEYNFRKKNNFKVEFVTKKNNPFPFELKAGIIANDGGAELNPYLFTKQLIENCKQENTQIYENTECIKIESLKDGKVKVITSYDHVIICDKVIISTGYHTAFFTKKQLCEKLITYSVVTKPIENFTWQNKTLLQDNSDPYHYIRFSHDNRFIIGGEDIPFKNNLIKEKKAKKKYKNLIKYVKKLFPQIKQQIEVDYSFCGVFSATKNNMGVYGSSSENENVWFCLGYGANGIINTIYGAQLLVSKYFNRDNKHAYLFSPKRKPL